MTSFENYLKGLLEQMLKSYKILNELKNTSGDLDIINKELAKINGLIQVVVNKINSSGNSSDKFLKLLSAGKWYLENYDFSNEIKTMGKLYSEDPNRLKNIRYAILKALQDKKLIQKVEELNEELK